MSRPTPQHFLKRGLKLVGALAAVLALSGCIVAPYGPRYGYYHPYRPYHYGYY